MGRTKLGQAAALTTREVAAFLGWTRTTSFPVRDEVIARLSFECGLRATEIARVRWWMAVDERRRVRPRLHLHAAATKGGYGARRLLIERKGLGRALERLLELEAPEALDGFVVRFWKFSIDPVIRSAAVQAFFRRGYDAIGCEDASSHSGRRTAITAVERRKGLPHAQAFAGHRSMATTGLYVGVDQAGIDQVVREELVVQVPRLVVGKFRMAKAGLQRRRVGVA